ncbi:MAG: hypothetical protein MZW92_31485 [Comamonadaceae bacterium]|nr:hypothetical protein [Comamonadaceae bacterium]
MKAHSAVLAAALPAMGAMGIGETTVREALAALEATATKDMVMGSRISRLHLAMRNSSYTKTLREILTRRWRPAPSDLGGVNVEEVINNGSPMASITMLQDMFKRGDISKSEMTHVAQTIDMWSSTGTIQALTGGLEKAKKDVETRKLLVERGVASSDDMAGEQAKNPVSAGSS